MILAQTQALTNWDYTPTFFQLQTFWAAITASWLTGWFLNWKPLDGSSFIKRWAILFVGVEVGVILGPHGFPLYGLITGAAGACMAIVSFDTIFALIQAWSKYLAGKLYPPKSNGTTALPDGFIRNLPSTPPVQPPTQNP
jgi:hypothetical protein